MTAREANVVSNKAGIEQLIRQQAEQFGLRVSIRWEKTQKTDEPKPNWNAVVSFAGSAKDCSIAFGNTLHLEMHWPAAGDPEDFVERELKEAQPSEYELLKKWDRIIAEALNQLAPPARQIGFNPSTRY